MDWLENLPAVQQEAVADVLFPVTAPVVKPLAPDQSMIAGDINDAEKPLNQLQSLFVRMVRARTQDPSVDKTRPPMILTGPGMDFAHEHVVCSSFIGTHPNWHNDDDSL